MSGRDTASQVGTTSKSWARRALTAGASSVVAGPSHLRRVGVLLVLALVASGLSFLVSPASAEAPEATAPWVQSDKDDYPPGALVQLSGGNWQPGESVHLYVNDDQGRTWERHSDVVADGTGGISDSFNLPDWFVATYKVLATGELSGTAATGFTDGNVKVDLTADVTASLDGTLFEGSASCGGTKTTAKTVPGTVGVGSADSLRLVAAATGTSTNGQRAFSHWTLKDNNNTSVSFTTLPDTGGRSICVVGFTAGTQNAVAHYASAVTTPSLTAAPASGVYGGTTSLTATLKSPSGTAISDRVVSFALGGTTVGTATTNASGVATLSNVSLAGTAAGTYSTRISASFAGDSQWGPASAAPAALTVTKAPLAITADDKSKTYGAPNPALTYSVTGLVNSDTRASALEVEPTLSTAAASAGAGVHAITVSGGTASNYTLSYTEGRLTVDKAPLTVTADDKGRAYGQENPTLTSSVSGLVNGDTRGSALPTEPTLGTGATAASAKGTYPITVSGGTASANYTLVTRNGTLTIAERAVTVTADPQTKTYGADDPAFTYSITSGSLAAGDSFTGALTRAPGQDVGTRAIQQGTLALDSNYALTFVGADLSITPRHVTVTANAASKTYGDADPALTYKITSGSPAYSDAFTGQLDRAEGQDVGAYAIRRGTLSLGNNYALTFAGADLTIGKRAVTVTADSRSKTYGDADPGLTYDVTSGSLAYSDAFTGALDRATGQDAGTYAIRQGTLALNANYALTYVGADLTIDERPITVTANSLGKTYGADDPALTYRVTTGELVGNDAISGTLQRVAGQGKGEYAINQGTLTAGPNYDLTFVPGTFTIAARAITVTAEPQTKTYGDGDPGLTYKVTDGSLATGDTFSGAPDRQTGENVGTYEIRQGTLDAGSNYLLTFEVANLRITKAPLTVTAADRTKVYGDVNPTLTGTVTGIKNGDAITGSFSTAAGGGSGAGTYAITAAANGTDAVLANYDIRTVNGTLSIIKAPLTVTAANNTKVYGSANPELTGTVTGIKNNDAITGGYTTTADATSGVGGHAITAQAVGTDAVLANYQITTTNGTLTITRAPLSVTAADKTKVYGDANPTLTGTVDGLRNGDTVTASYTTRADASSPVGDHAIIAAVTGEALANYTVALGNGTLTITKAPLSVTAADKTKVYGDANPTLTGTVDGLRNGDTVTASYTTRADASSPVGDHAIIAAVTGDALANYEVTPRNATLTITKAPLSVTAADRTKVYGDANPTLTGTVTGIKNGDAITGAYSTAAGAGSGVGTYAITAAANGTDAVLANYDIRTVNGTLTITKAPLSVTAADTTKVYGDANPTLTGTVTGIKNNDAITGGYTTAAGAGSGVGTFAITASANGTDAVLANYDIRTTNGTLTITKAPLSVTAADKTKVYGDANPTLTGTVTGVRNGDAITAKYTTAADEKSGVGTHAITPTAEGTAGVLANYDVTLVPGTLAITPKALTVKVADSTKILGAPNPAFTVTYDGFVLGQDRTVLGGDLSFTTLATTTSGVGTYSVTASGLTSSNYTISYTPGTLRIVYGWNGFLQPINDTAHQVGVQQSKFKLGQTIPAKFVLKDAAGNVVTQSTNPKFSVSTNRGACDATAALDTVPTVVPESGQQYTWTGTHYQYNWSTKGLTSGEYRMWAHLADGTSVSYVDICLTK